MQILPWPIGQLGLSYVQPYAQTHSSPTGFIQAAAEATAYASLKDGVKESPPKVLGQCHLW